MSKIHTELCNILHQNDYAWVKKIIKYGNIEVEPEVDVGENRTLDFLVTILNYQGNEEQKVAIEVEGDREFDAEGVLRKIKRDRRYPTIVIIPNQNEPDAWRFQQSDFYVWYWTATCRWNCRNCSVISTSTSSITPVKCSNCGAGSNNLSWLTPIENVNFEEAKNNPSMTYSEVQRKHGPGFAVLEW